MQEDIVKQTQAPGARSVLFLKIIHLLFLKNFRKAEGTMRLIHAHLGMIVSDFLNENTNLTLSFPWFSFSCFSADVADV
jgi:hypothetical protein